MAEKIFLNEGWQFTPKYTDDLNEVSVSTDRLVDVRIPHTVKETPFHYFDESIYQMVSGYRRVLHAEKEWEGKRVLLTFDGVGHGAYVYLNGELVAEHHNGYTAFTAELTSLLKYGEDNILAVKVDSMEDQNIPPFGYAIDYMTYGGIYRDVYLDIKESTYISDIFVRPEVAPDNHLALPGIANNGKKMAEKIKTYACEGDVNFDISLDYTDELRADQVQIEITEYNKTEVLFSETYKIDASKEETDLLKYTVRLHNAKLWDVVAPNLYQAKVTLYQGDTAIDEYPVHFGFRKSEFKVDGYYLNGRRLNIRGLNRHQSFPYVGYAMPQSQQKADADILRFELGVNAVRTSHYPQSQYFIDRCDEIGLLVFTEIPGWQHIGDAEWKDQAVENVAEMVTQYRNHPSIIIWGVRINESLDDDEFYTRTNKVAHDLDPTRQTGGVRYLKKSHLLEDVYTYNDFLHDGKTAPVDKKSKVSSDMNKPYLISEYNGHMYPTKTFDDEPHRLEHALRHANVLNAVAGDHEISGSFGWCMFDYNTHKDFGSGDRICYHGVTDMFRNPKMAAAVYASQQNNTPYMEVSSSMDIGEHPAGNRGQVYVFTNVEKVRVYKNDQFIREYTREDTPYKNMKNPPILVDDFIGDIMKETEGFSDHQNKLVKTALNYIGQYGMNHLPLNIQAKMGEAMAVYHMKFEDAYALYGKYVGNWGKTSTTFRFDGLIGDEVVKSITKSTMSSVHIEVQLDHDTLEEKNSYDVAALRIRMCDDHNNTVCMFNSSLPLTIDGPAEIIGPKRAFMAGGMGGTYIKSIGKNGDITLTVNPPEEWEGLIQPVTVKLKAIGA